MSFLQRHRIASGHRKGARIIVALLAAAVASVSMGTHCVRATTYTWTGAAGNNLWSGITGGVTNWSPNTLPPTTQSIMFTNTTSFPTIDLQTDRVINDVTFGGTQGYNLTDGTLTVTSGTITVNGGTSPATHTISVPLTLGAAGTFNIASPETLSIRGGIGDGGNNYGLTKSGTGTLTLQDQSSNLYQLSATAGTLNIDHATITTRLGNDFGFSFAANTNVTHGAQLINAATGFLKVAGANLPVLTIDGSTTSATGSTYFLTGFGGMPGALDIRNQAQVSTGIFVVSVGDEGLVASTAIIHSGATVTAGAFSIGGATGALGTVTVTDKDTAVTTDSLLLGGFNTSIFGGTTSMTIQSGAQVTANTETSFFTTTSTLVIDRGALTTARLGTYNGATPLIKISNSGPTAALLITNADVNTTSTYAGTITDAADGPGGIRKIGAGNQIFAGTSTYTGGTRIEAGTLTVGVANALPTAGAITLAGGTLDLGGNLQQAGVVTLAGGVITTIAPGILFPTSLALQTGTLAAQTFTTGAVNKTTAGVVTVSAPLMAASITVSSGTLALDQGASAPTVQVNGAILQLAGTLQGALLSNATGSIALTGAATVSGSTALSGSLAIGVYSLVSDSTQTLTAGSLTISGGMLLAKSGVTVSGVASGFGTITGKVSGASPASWTASGGTLTLGDAGDANGFTGFGGTLAAGSNQMNLLSAGVATLGSSNTVAGGTIASLNGVQLGAGRTLSGFGAITGPVQNLGTVTGGSGPNVLKFTGAVNGNGNFAGNIEFDGSYSPGNSPAAVLFTGNATLGALSQLKMELGGETLGAEYDHVNVDGTLTLGGALSLSLINTFQPAIGDSFDLLDWGVLSGQFSIVQLPSLAAPLAWDTSNLYTTGTVTVVPEPASFALLGMGLLILTRRSSRS